MRVKVELHPDVVRYLRHWCTPEERDEFWRKREVVRQQPIGKSEPIFDPKLCKYQLRCFRFGKGIEKVAIFHFDIVRNTLRVIKCRPARPKRRRNGRQIGGARPP